MAFGSIGTLGSNQSGTDNLSSLAITTSAAAEAGNYVVVIIAVDNFDTTEGETSAVSSVANSGTANTWVKLKEYTDPGAASATTGATVSMWGSLITTTISSGGTITANFTNSTARDAAAMTAWEFSIAGSVTIEVEASNTFAGASTALSGFDATTANIECLRIVGSAHEDNSTNQWLDSPDNFGNEFTLNGTVGGGGAANMVVRGNFQISTGTGLSWTFISGPNASDSAAVYVALKEVASGPTAWAGEERLNGAGNLSNNALLIGRAQSSLLGVGSLSANVTQNMAAQERLGGTSSFSADATITSVGTAHVGEARLAGAGNLSANVTAQLQAAAILSPDVRDDFNRADGAPGASWTTVTGFSALEITSNVARATATAAHCAAYWNANTFSDDQFAECTITQLGAGTAFIGLTLRHQAGASNSFYASYLNEAGLPQIYKWTAGTPVLLSGNATVGFVAGDVLRFEASGTATTNLIARKNGTIINSISDSTSPFTGGSPGLNLFANGVNDARADNWSAGALPNSILSVDATVVTGGATQQAEARFTGAGSISIDIQNTKQAAANLAGAGSVSVNALLAQVGRAIFSGASSFSVNATASAVQAGEARFVGAGSLSINTTIMQAAATTLAGTGSLSVNTRQTMAMQATFQGAGLFSPLVSQAWAVGAIFAGAGNLSFHGMQIVPLIPDGDSSTGSWLNEVDSLPLFPSLDEIVPLDADYIKSTPAPTVDICKISLSNPTTSTLVAPVSVLYRYGKSGTDTAVLQVRLLQGTTMIAVWQHNDIAAGFVTIEQFLDDGMIANITDWNNLFLEFQSGTITSHMARANFSGSGVM